MQRRVIIDKYTAVIEAMYAGSVVETGSDPTRIPLAALLAPIAATGAAVPVVVGLLQGGVEAEALR